MPKCITPFTIRNKFTNQSFAVPCGKCEICIKKRISGWSVRLMYEAKNCDSALFLCLSYDTDHVPITKNGFMSLDKPDVQKFMKRLRKAHEGVSNFRPIKYYLVGEYGGLRMRPHYHIIIFNCDWQKVDVEKVWGKGNIHFGFDVGPASVGYCMKYMYKPNKVPLHRNDDRVPEFGLMSKGIGITYIDDNENVRFHHRGEGKMYMVLEDGKKSTMPRYYKERIFTKVERQVIGIKALKAMEDRMSRVDVDSRSVTESHLASFRRLEFLGKIGKNKEI